MARTGLVLVSAPIALKASAPPGVRTRRVSRKNARVASAQSSVSS